MNVKTKSFTKNDVTKEWKILDASGKSLGRTAATAAKILRGKHTPKYTPNSDCGDYVIIINAKLAKMTGKKYDEKMYYHFTGYIGNLKSCTYKKLLSDHPEKPMYLAVKGMLPKGPLGRKC